MLQNRESENATNLWYLLCVLRIQLPMPDESPLCLRLLEWRARDEINYIIYYSFIGKLDVWSSERAIIIIKIVHVHQKQTHTLQNSMAS